MKQCKHAPDNIGCSHPELIKILDNRAKEINLETYGNFCPFAPASFQEYLRPLCRYYEPK